MAAEEGLVEGALEAVAIDSPTSFYWFGARTGAASQRIRSSIGGTKTRVYLKRILQGRLYRDFYCRGRATPAEDASPPRGSPRLTPFIGALSAANSGSGSREPGWMVRGIEDGQVVVERNGLSVWVGPDDIYGAPHAPRPGDECAIRFPKELLGLFPGFYMALGNLGLVPSQATTFVRFYWNLQSGGAPLLLEAATQMLNRDKIPFQLKVLSDPDLYDRCDAGVLYVEKSGYPRVADAVRRIYRNLSNHLNPSTPVFTKRLASGLALAEGPPDSTESFGASRCGMLAEGIIRAWEEGAEQVSARMEWVAESFADAGIGLDSPFLSPGSTDDYGFAW
jgi:HopA1 effector protein family